jgi:alpha-1,4-digalacturonate transport system permease protein
VFFFPVLLSPVVVALIWKWILQREGVLNAFLDWSGPGGFNWLVDAQWAFAWSVFLSVWANMGFYTLILLAGLQAIPRDVYEAATMDRASPWRAFTQDHPAASDAHDAGGAGPGADQGCADL